MSESNDEHDQRSRILELAAHLASLASGLNEMNEGNSVISVEGLTLGQATDSLCTAAEALQNYVRHYDIAVLEEAKEMRILRESCHPFYAKVATRSKAKLPPRGAPPRMTA